MLSTWAHLSGVPPLPPRGQNKAFVSESLYTSSSMRSCSFCPFLKVSRKGGLLFNWRLTFLITRVSMPAAIFWTLAKTNHFLPKNICDLIRMILTMNNFSFNNEHYLQKHGTAMRTRMAPSYANLFIGKFEQQAIDNSLLKPFIWWRFIDDIFMIWKIGRASCRERV